MANLKVRIRPEGANSYGDVLHPETSADIIDGLGMWGITTGTNAYIVAVPYITSLYAGVKVTVKFGVANTSTSTTINVNSLGVKNIRKPGGGTLPAGTLKLNGVYTLVYDGTSFQLQGEGGEYGTALASDVLAPKTLGTDTGIQTGTMVNRGAVNATITTQGGSYTIPKDYHSGAGKVTASFANLIAANVKSGINIGGVVGLHEGTNFFNADIRYPHTGEQWLNVYLPNGKKASLVIIMYAINKSITLPVFYASFSDGKYLSANLHLNIGILAIDTLDSSSFRFKANKPGDYHYIAIS